MWLTGRRGRHQDFGRCLAVVLLAYLLLLGLTVHLWQPHSHGSPLSLHRSLQGLQLSGSNDLKEDSPLTVLDVQDPQPGRAASLLAALMQSSSHEEANSKEYTEGMDAWTKGQHVDRGAADVKSKTKSSTQPTPLTANPGQGEDSKDRVQSPSTNHGKSNVHPLRFNEGMDGDVLNVPFHRIGTLYVYGAYLDVRSGDRAQVRLLVLRPRRTDSPGVACTFPMPPAWEKTWGVRRALEALGVRVTARGATVHAARYELCENHGKTYGGWIYTCSVPPGLPAPSHVILEPVPPTPRINSSENLLNTWGESVEAKTTKGSIQALPQLNEDDRSRHRTQQMQTNAAPNTIVGNPSSNSVDNLVNAKISQATLFDSGGTNSKNYLSETGSRNLKIYQTTKISEDLSKFSASKREMPSTTEDKQFERSTAANSLPRFFEKENGRNAQSSSHWNITHSKASPTLSVSLSSLAQTGGQKLSIGVCIPPLWGHVSMPHLIQYVELSRLLGASRVILYQYNVTDTIARLLQFLSRRGDVTVVRWHPPGEAMGGGGVWYEGQALAVQHCLYTFMPRFQYLAFFDLDEVLVPKRHKTWQQLLQELASKPDSTHRKFLKENLPSSSRHKLDAQRIYPRADSMPLSELEKFGESNSGEHVKSGVYQKSIFGEKVNELHQVTRQELQGDVKLMGSLPDESVDKVQATEDTVLTFSNKKLTPTEEASHRNSVRTHSDEIKENQNPVVAFSFQSAFFDPRQLPEPSQRMPFMQALQRTQHVSEVRSKVIVEPQMVFEMGIHHVSSLLTKNVSMLKVNQSDALLHHYRPCLVNFDPNMTCFPTVTDNSMLRYSAELEEKVHRTTREFLLQLQRVQGRS